MILSVFPAIVSYSNLTPALTKSGLAFLTLSNTWFFTSVFISPFWTSFPVSIRTGGSFGTADNTLTVNVLAGVADSVLFPALSVAFNVTVNPPLGILYFPPSWFNWIFKSPLIVSFLAPVTPPFFVNVVVLLL